MPFAPTILDKYANKYLKNFNLEKNKPSFMITAFHATNIAEKHLRAAIHQGDKTLRPQVLFKKDNPKYYDLISNFEKKTNIGALLNTSFNLHGYPLVSNIEQAFFTFENSELEYLCLENYLIKKKINYFIPEQIAKR